MSKRRNKKTIKQRIHSYVLFLSKRVLVKKIKKHVKHIQKNDRVIKMHLPEILIVIGVLFMSSSFLHRYLQQKSLSMSQALVLEYKEVQVRKPAPTHIYIQWFIDTSIEEQTINNGNWGISKDIASHIFESSNPAEGGNIIIYGHNTRKILGNIRALKGGEKITLTTSDGVLHYYQVESLHEVDPKNTQYLEPSSVEMLTLYTCSGFMDKNRFIVRAMPLDTVKSD